MLRTYSTDDAWDTLHNPSHPHIHWTTTNVGEGLPGVLTPLSWSLWRESAEASLRGAPFAIGAMSADEAAVPAAQLQRYITTFYGRVAMQCEFMGLLGDRMPGTTGAEALESLLGRVPDDMEFHPTRRRYPAVAWWFPLTFLRTPGRLAWLERDVDAWWRRSVAAAPGLPEAEAAALLARAADRLTESCLVQTTVAFAVVQPLFDALSRLVEKAGAGDVSALSGSGGAEMGVIQDLWRASRGEIGIDGVVANHGFHGPREGELSSAVWRVDPSPLERIVEQYAQRDATDSPAAVEAEHDRRAEVASRELLAAVPATQRPAVRGLLRLAQSRIPLRGVAKRSYVQAYDVARAASHRLAELLVADGRLDDPDDVFYLTVDELTGAFPVDARDLVAKRRGRREEYLALDIATNWTGVPEAFPVAAPAASEDERVLPGMGVSGGVVEGVARVVTDPGFADVEPDEVLIAPTTDPSWSSIMFISAALVVDIGGALSHAALVARELKIPCVVNTRNATAAVRTGDHVRVDGDAGTVEILDRAL